MEITYANLTNKVLTVMYLKSSIPRNNHSMANVAKSSCEAPIYNNFLYGANCGTNKITPMYSNVTMTVKLRFSVNSWEKVLFSFSLSPLHFAISLTPRVDIPNMANREKYCTMLCTKLHIPIFVTPNTRATYG